MVRSRGLEPPRVAPLAPQASASTNSATTACEEEAGPSRRLARAHVTNRPGGDKSSENVGKSALVRRARQHFLDLDRNAIAVHHDGAPRDREVVGEDLHLVL